MSAAARILEFVKPGEFDEFDMKAIDEAFEAASKELHDRGQPRIVREVLARKIIEAAKRGERDPARLRDIALSAFPKRE